MKLIWILTQINLQYRLLIKSSNQKKNNKKDNIKNIIHHQNPYHLKEEEIILKNLTDQDQEKKIKNTNKKNKKNINKKNIKNKNIDQGHLTLVHFPIKDTKINLQIKRNMNDNINTLKDNMSRKKSLL